MRTPLQIICKLRSVKASPCNLRQFAAEPELGYQRSSDWSVRRAVNGDRVR
jgi:hypothetical protein